MPVIFALVLFVVFFLFLSAFACLILAEVVSTDFCGRLIYLTIDVFVSKHLLDNKMN